MKLTELVSYCDDLLASGEIKDYAPNGLQVESGDEARVVVTAVTASMAAIEAAIEHEADVLLVHHGYFWKGESQALTGMKGQRIAKLIRAGISLVGYHLPLDVHLELGNNAGLGRAIGAAQVQQRAAGGIPNLLWRGEVTPTDTAGFAGQLAHALDREPLHVGPVGPIQRVAWCTGGAQDYLSQAAELGVDAFVSGEISERTTHMARELGVQYFAAGHHATERFGVQALGEHLAEQFDIRTLYVEDFNPV
ncbi:MAG: Nif3-like dinuclear metal center hexameric protein [Gammaproteobacteria bacterium]|nr:Nif3-like dinuclear metal center hexameric protein [Gammaproteobacteria bacterium]